MSQSMIGVIRGVFVLVVMLLGVVAEGGVAEIKAAEKKIAGFETKARDAGLGVDDRRAAVDAAIEGYEGLIKKYAVKLLREKGEGDDAMRERVQYVLLKRIVWHSQCVELCVELRLEELGYYAMMFYEVGSGRADQRAWVESYLPRAMGHIKEANRYIGGLRREMARDPELKERLYEEDLDDLIFEKYKRVVLPYFEAKVSLMLAGMGEGTRYYDGIVEGFVGNARQQKWVSHQKKLYERVVVQTEEFIAVNHPGLKGRSLLLRAKAMVGKGHFKHATLKFNQIVEEEEDAALRFEAKVGHAMSAGKRGQGLRAIELLRKLEADVYLKGKGAEVLAWRVLLSDAGFGVDEGVALKLGAVARAATMKRAYGHYMRLLESRWFMGLDEGVRDYIRFEMIYPRWLIANEGKTIGEMSSVVVIAVVNTSLQNGQRMMQEIADGDLGVQKVEKVQAVLNRVISLAGGLEKRGDISLKQRAELLFARGHAQYYLGNFDKTDYLEAIKTWGRLAKDYPSQKISLKGASYAAQTFENLYVEGKESKALVEAYLSLVDVLLEKYPEDDVTHGQIVHYAQLKLLPKKQFGEAIRLLRKVGQGHRGYLNAAVVRLESGVQWLGRPGCAVSIEGLQAEAGVLLKACSKRLDALKDGGGGGGRDVINGVIGRVKLYQGVLYLKEDKQREAGRVFEEITARFGDDEDLMGLVYGYQVEVYLSLDDEKGLVGLLSRMRRSEGLDHHGILRGVVGAYLERVLKSRIAGGKVDQGRHGLIVSVAKDLVGGQLKTENGLYDRVQLVRLYEAGKAYEDGLELIAELKRDYGAVVDLLLLEADIYYSRGMRAADKEEKVKELKAAIVSYDQLIRGLKLGKDGKMPAMWWESWIKRLDAMLAIDEGLEKQVLFAIRATLMQNDSELGGEGFKERILRIQNRAALKAK